MYAYFNMPLFATKKSYFVFLIDKEKFVFYDSYHEICEKNWFHPAKCVKLCDLLDTKNTNMSLLFKNVSRREDNLKI